MVRRQEYVPMKSKHWLLAGVGCIAASILVGIAMWFYWEDQARRSFASAGAADPFQDFGIVMVAAVSGNLLFFGGIVALTIGFIKFAKEPSSDARRASASQERSDSGAELRRLREENARLREHLAGQVGSEVSVLSGKCPACGAAISPDAARCPDCQTALR
jgi:hypothetical protein